MKDKAIEPILILNPETKRYFNIGPLVDDINFYFEHDFSYAANKIDQAIELLVCNFSKIPGYQPEDISNHLYDLFKIRNAFLKIKEFKEN